MTFKAGFHASRWAHSRRKISAAGAMESQAHFVFSFIAEKGGESRRVGLYRAAKQVPCLRRCVHMVHLENRACLRAARKSTRLAGAISCRGAGWASSPPCLSCTLNVFWEMGEKCEQNLCSLSLPALGAARCSRALARDGDVGCGNQTLGRAVEGRARPSLAPRDGCFFVDVSQREFCDKVG